MGLYGSEMGESDLSTNTVVTLYIIYPSGLESPSVPIWSGAILVCSTGYPSPERDGSSRPVIVRDSDSAAFRIRLDYICLSRGA